MGKSVLFLLVISVNLVYSQNGLNILSSALLEERHDFETLLIDILLNTLRPYKCLAILCDSIYYDMFRETIFQKMGLYITYFIILIEDSDDLLSPYPDTQESLTMIKRQDCQTYIILISNGIQMSRLLRYGYRYRILDTRSNFILLYDKRLFDKELHYIWKSIINVIFVRAYGGAKKSSGTEKTVPWFELSTIPFPAPIQGVLVPRRLDIWRQSKFRTGADLFRDKTNDLRNQTLRVATFQHIPAATKMAFPEFKSVRTVLGSGDMGFTGIEVEILATVSQAMNFFPDLYEPENVDREFWGYKHSDGRYSGLFGELIKSRADIGLGDFYYTPAILDVMDLTMPYNTECLTFLTPEALTDNSWKALILPFKPIMWALVITSILVSATIFYALARFHQGIHEEHITTTGQEIEAATKNKRDILLAINASDKIITPNVKYVLMKQQYETPKIVGDVEGLYLFGEKFNCFLYTYSMLLMVSLPKLPTGWSLRIFTGWYWIYCTLVVVAYRASMTAILANPPPSVTIDTLEELVDSNLAVGSWSDINRNFFLTSLDQASQTIGERYEIVNDTDLAIDRVAMGKFAFYENTHFLKQALVRRQLRVELQNAHANISNATQLVLISDEKNARNLHIASECVIKMPISIGMQKNSPIKPRVDKFIRRVLEAGLIKKWLDDVMQTTLNSEVTDDTTIKPVMSMAKFISAIVALFIGYFISIVAFIAEIVYFRRVVQKDPNFDKYSKQIYHEKKQ